MERLAVGRGRLLPSKAPSKEKVERGPENPAGQAWCSLGLFQEVRSRGFGCKPSLQKDRKPGTQAFPALSAKRRGKSKLSHSHYEEDRFWVTPEEKDFEKLCVGSIACHRSAEFPWNTALSHLSAVGLSISNVDSHPAAQGDPAHLHRDIRRVS